MKPFVQRPHFKILTPNPFFFSIFDCQNIRYSVMILSFFVFFLRDPPFFPATHVVSSRCNIFRKQKELIKQCQHILFGDGVF